MPIEKYGATFVDGASEAVIELSCAFNQQDASGQPLSAASGFLGFYEHLHRAIDLIWNQKGEFFIWNEWSELLMRSFIENREVPVTGPSSSWKTTCLGCYIVCFWLADPLRSKVIPSSTSLGGLRERIWKDVIKFYRASGVSFGNIINHPHPKIQTVKGDDASGIHGIAVEQGDVDSAIDRIKGRHAPNVLVAIDEGTGAQPAIVEACVNLSTGCNRYQLIMLANMCSLFDEFGKLAEPELGWNSVGVEHTTWTTKRGGLAVHLDGHKSPNVLAGYKKYPGLISQEDLDTAARQYGENSPRYWQERRGFAPPEGIAKTVLTETMIEKFHGRDKAVWTDEPPIMIAGLDPAYGGDRCVLRFAKVGSIVSNEQRHRVIEFGDILCLKLDVTLRDPIHYQIAKQVREECKARGVDPENFGMDTSGEGGGVASLFKREWSESILEVEFGGNASDRAVSEINPRPGTKEWVNRVTELWMRFRAALERDQIRGLDYQTCIEFCQRNIDHQKYAPRSRVESKSEMKGLKGLSPDYADAAVIVTELALVRGFIESEVPNSRLPSTRNKSWLRFASDMVPLSEYASA